MNRTQKVELNKNLLYIPFRNRAYNQVQLVEFIAVELEDYYRDRFAKFARGEDLFIRQKLKSVLERAQYITDASAIAQLRNDLFVVKQLAANGSCFFSKK